VNELRTIEISARPFEAVVCATLLLFVPTSHALAQTALSGDGISIKRAAGKITVDGDLSDEGWRNATRVEKWYEVNPGDNTEPKVRNVGYLAYDDRFFYAGFEFDDLDICGGPRAVCRIATVPPGARIGSASVGTAPVSV
jgi:hypothetical protein